MLVAGYCDVEFPLRYSLHNPLAVQRTPATATGEQRYAMSNRDVKTRCQRLVNRLLNTTSTTHHIYLEYVCTYIHTYVILCQS